MTKPIRYVLVDDLPEARKESPHDNHILDDNWCYDCNRIIKDDEYPVGNNKWNKYRTEALSKCRELDLDKLSDVIIKADIDYHKKVDDEQDLEGLAYNFAQAIIQHIKDGAVVK